MLKNGTSDFIKVNIISYQIDTLFSFGIIKQMIGI